ncbi:MAG: hypothetical protein JW395_4086 [Nitrospira sp.]|nr:hypothetical protein [Nitrospira sp.]
MILLIEILVANGVGPVKNILMFPIDFLRRKYLTNQFVFYDFRNNARMPSEGSEYFGIINKHFYGKFL